VDLGDLLILLTPEDFKKVWTTRFGVAFPLLICMGFFYS
jgi:hypothetical protein